MVAVKQETTVQAGGIIQIHSDQFAPGARAEVIVLIEQSAPCTFPTMRSLIGAAPGGFKNPAEIDAFLRAERDAWERAEKIV
jgi:hypothetical protein